jgi:hypothetical protein
VSDEAADSSPRQRSEPAGLVRMTEQPAPDPMLTDAADAYFAIRSPRKDSAHTTADYRRDLCLNMMWVGWSHAYRRARRWRALLYVGFRLSAVVRAVPAVAIVPRVAAKVVVVAVIGAIPVAPVATPVLVEAHVGPFQFP